MNTIGDQLVETSYENEFIRIWSRIDKDQFQRTGLRLPKKELLEMVLAEQKQTVPWKQQRSNFLEHCHKMRNLINQ